LITFSHQHHQGQGGVIFGDFVYNNYGENAHNNEITLLQEKLAHAEDKIRLLENQLSVLQNLLGGQKPSSH